MSCPYCPIFRTDGDVALSLGCIRLLVRTGQFETALQLYGHLEDMAVWTQCFFQWTWVSQHGCCFGDNSGVTSYPFVFLRSISKSWCGKAPWWHRVFQTNTSAGRRHISTMDIRASWIQILNDSQWRRTWSRYASLRCLHRCIKAINKKLENEWCFINSPVPWYMIHYYHFIESKLWLYEPFQKLRTLAVSEAPCSTI